MTALACVTGRFQPLHTDHVDLLRRALHDADRLVVGITNPDPSARREVPESAVRHLAAANPFTYHERQAMVRAALRDLDVTAEDVDVVPFPLHDPDVWPDYVPLSAVQHVRVFSPWEERKVVLLRQGGYRVEVLRPTGAKGITGTGIRRQLANGDPAWRALVPSSVVALVEAAAGRAPAAGPAR
jgi:nicotinamide-nucleotide adenylyltransferase